MEHRKPVMQEVKPAMQSVMQEIAGNTIAVLPLQNMSNNSSVDYLRYALADEVASMLTYNRSLDVRLSGRTRKYVAADQDLEEVGKELHVAEVVIGRYLLQGKEIMVRLQAVNAASNRVTWESTLIRAPSQDFIALQDALAKQVRSGLLPALGVGNELLETSTRPKNQQAYDL